MYDARKVGSIAMLEKCKDRNVYVSAWDPNDFSLLGAPSVLGSQQPDLVDV